MIISAIFLVILLISFGFQIGCGIFLLIYTSHRVKSQIFSAEQQSILFAGLVFLPISMFLLTFVFTPYYCCDKGEHWFYYVHYGSAGLVLLPIYLIASISLSKAIYNNHYLATSRENYVMIATLAAIAAWYTYATLYLNLTKDDVLDELQILALVPAITCFNYLIFLIIIAKKARLKPLNPLFALVWFSTLIASVMAKYPLAKSFYEQLPPKPSGYGDCFVVSAAAQGHPWLVQSWNHPNLGKPVNCQWYIFKSFEVWLAHHFPSFHGKLRTIYNQVGPVIAKRIRHAWQADLVYLVLKPLEWSIFLVLKLINR